VTALPLVAPVARTAAERAARAGALRVALAPPEGWPDRAREDFEERLAIMAAAGVPDARRVAEDAVRATLLRSIT
jgi:hypothetical protein